MDNKKSVIKSVRIPVELNEKIILLAKDRIWTIIACIVNILKSAVDKF